MSFHVRTNQDDRIEELAKLVENRTLALKDAVWIAQAGTVPSHEIIDGWRETLGWRPMTLNMKNVAQRIAQDETSLLDKLARAFKRLEEKNEQSR